MIRMGKFRGNWLCYFFNCWKFYCCIFFGLFCMVIIVVHEFNYEI